MTRFYRLYICWYSGYAPPTRLGLLIRLKGDWFGLIFFALDTRTILSWRPSVMPSLTSLMLSFYGNGILLR